MTTIASIAVLIVDIGHHISVVLGGIGRSWDKNRLERQAARAEIVDFCARSLNIVLESGPKACAGIELGMCCESPSEGTLEI